MHEPLHALVQGFDILRISTDQPGGQVGFNQRKDGTATASTGIGISRALGPVSQRDGQGNQFEMRMIAVHGIAQDLIQRHTEQSRPDGDDGAAGAAQ